MEIKSKQRGPYVPVISGRALYVCGLTCTVWCFALWFIIPTLLLGIGSGVAIGYGAFYDDDPCFREMDRWVVSDHLDWNLHAVAFFNNEYYHVQDHKVPGDSCLTRLSETLRTKKGISFLPQETQETQGRRLDDNNKGCKSCIHKHSYDIGTCVSNLQNYDEGMTQGDCVMLSCKKECSGSTTHAAGIIYCDSACAAAADKSKREAIAEEAGFNPNQPFSTYSAAQQRYVLYEA